MEYMKDIPKDDSMDEMVLTFESETGYAFDLEVTVTAEYDPGQRGGWDDPSWPAGHCAPRAFWHRPGRGWKELELSDWQKDQIAERFDQIAEGNEEAERERAFDRDEWDRNNDYWS